MRRTVLIGAALAWSGAALAQTAPLAAQKALLDPAAAVLGGVFTGAPQIGGTVVPAQGASLLPPFVPQRAPGVMQNAGAETRPERPPGTQPGAPVIPPPPAKASGLAFKPVEYGKLVVRLEVGDPFFVLQSGPGCAVAKTLTYPGGVSEYKLPGAKEAFHDELARAGLAVAGDPNDLFNSGMVSADYVISGIATQFHQEVCSPTPAGGAVQNGRMHLAVEWQLYSRLEKQVLATVNTSADYSIGEPVSGGGSVMAYRVFELNLRQLAASPEIRRVLAGPSRIDVTSQPNQAGHR